MTRADPLTVTCPHCEATPGERCMMLSDYARKPHAARVRLAQVLAADADPALDEFFPKVGPCGICGTPGLDQRHRVVDAIADRLAAGEWSHEVAEDYGLPLEAMAVVKAWTAKWGRA